MSRSRASFKMRLGAVSYASACGAATHDLSLTSDDAAAQTGITLKRHAF
jgi:hypothetical protein